MLCEEWTLAKREGQYVTYYPLRCRSWHCELCAPRRKSQLIDEALAGKPDLFITLTVNPDRFDTPDARAQALVKAWRTVRRRWKKANNNDNIPCFCVLEATKRGEPHLHIAARCRWLDQKWLSTQMHELIGAPIVDVRRIRRRDKAAAYLCKYIGKAPQRFAGTKRYWKTRDYKTEDHVDDGPPPILDGHWFILEKPFTQLLQYFSNIGIVIEHRKSSFKIDAETYERITQVPP